MLDSDRRHYLGRSLEMLTGVGRDLDKTAGRLRSMRRGYPSNAMGGSGGGNGETQPERNALKADPAAKDLRRFDRLVHEIYERAFELDAITKSTAERAGSPSLANEGCRSCARVKLWSSTASGRDGYCDWCYRFKLDHDQEPPRVLLELRARGVRITQRVVDNALADVAERVRHAAMRTGKRRKASAGR